MNIEKNVPLPITMKKTRYPFEQMEIGDSIVFDLRDKQCVAQAATHLKQRNPEWNYTTRREGNNFRLWRTEVVK